MTSVVERSEKTATDDPTLASRGIDLFFDHVRQVFADPSLLDTIPNGAQLVLLPDDDPELFEAELAAGVRALRRGDEVVFRHMRRAGGERRRGRVARQTTFRDGHDGRPRARRRVRRRR